MPFILESITQFERIKKNLYNVQKICIINIGKNRTTCSTRIDQRIFGIFAQQSLPRYQDIFDSLSLRYFVIDIFFTSDDNLTQFFKKNF